MGISTINPFGFETVSVDIDFVTSTSSNVIIPISRNMREVVRGRLYIDEDPGSAFSAWATYTFYCKAAMHGADAFFRTDAKLVYTELKVATTGSGTVIVPDDHTDFNPNDLALILASGNNEFVRLKNIASTMIAEDTVGIHNIDDGFVRVSEFSGFSLFNNENEDDVYLNVRFAVAQTVSLKMEMLLRK